MADQSPPPPKKAKADALISPEAQDRRPLGQATEPSALLQGGPARVSLPADYQQHERAEESEEYVCVAGEEYYGTGAFITDKKLLERGNALIRLVKVLHDDDDVTDDEYATILREGLALLLKSKDPEKVMVLADLHCLTSLEFSGSDSSALIAEIDEDTYMRTLLALFLWGADFDKGVGGRTARIAMGEEKYEVIRSKAENMAQTGGNDNPDVFAVEF